MKSSSLNGGVIFNACAISSLTALSSRPKNEKKISGMKSLVHHLFTVECAVEGICQCPSSIMTILGVLKKSDV